MSTVSGIQGQLLEITVVGCNKLKNTVWISRKGPYVRLEYASTRQSTRTCNGGGKDPTFQDKFVFTLVEGLQEINVTVWNSHKLSSDDFIGDGKVLLQGVLCQGDDDRAWPLQDKKGRHAGEVQLVMRYANAKKLTTSHAPSAPPYAPFPAPPVSSHPPFTANYPALVPPPYPSHLPNYPPPPYHHHPSPCHPAYQAPSPRYPQQPAYPPPPPPHPSILLPSRYISSTSSGHHIHTEPCSGVIYELRGSANRSWLYI